MGVDLYGPHFVTGDSAVAALARTLNQLVENILAGATPATGSVTDAKVAADAAIAQSKIAGLVADLATKLNAAGIVAKAAATTNQDRDGLDVIDGYQTVAGDQVLLTGQTTPSENGPWIVAAGAWTRPADFATGSVHLGRAIVVSGGTLAGSVWTLNTTAPVTVGTTAQTWLNAPVRSGTLVETAPTGLQQITQADDGSTPLKINAHAGDVSGSFKRALEIWNPNAPWSPLGLPLYIRSDNLGFYSPAAITISTQLAAPVNGVPQIATPSPTYMMGVWNDLNAGFPSYVSRDSGVGGVDVSDHFWALDRNGVKTLTIGPKGNIGSGVPHDAAIQVFIRAKAIADRSLVVRQLTGQTGLLTVWENADAVAVASMAVSGDFTLAGATGTPGILFIGSDTNYLRKTGTNALATDARFRTHAGTVAAPAVSFVSDTTSGMYSYTAGVLAFAANGVERLRLGANNKARFTDALSCLRVTAPGDADLAASEGSIWWKNTAGAAGFQVKGKDSAGALVAFDFSRQAAQPDTSGATLAALETEVNGLKAKLRTMGVMA